ncbi:MAG TPA: hypothetical protein DCW83_11490 [Saprospirales bacterium]|nr:hypothetical protein [Saprospirales bacterium]
MDKMNEADKTYRGASRWLFAARVIPMLLLGIIIIAWLIGGDTVFRMAMCISVSTMFTCSVLWWHWAVGRIVTLWKHNNQTSEQTDDMLSHLTVIRELLDEIRTNK